MPYTNIPKKCVGSTTNKTRAACLGSEGAVDGPDSVPEEVDIPIMMWPAQKVGKSAHYTFFDKRR